MNTTLPCSCCGNLLAFPDDVPLCTCPACGTDNARPRSTGEPLAILERATRQRLAGEFASAETSYQQVLLINPDESEALWGRLLCHYGVAYVEDPATGRRVPTVQSVRPRSLQEQPDFATACEYAPAAVREQMQRDAVYIDKAQAKIRQLAATQPGWDIFICNKTTLASGGYTQDHLHATRLYYHLKEQGLRVFFAPECLQGAAGANYEAAIYHALHTARFMLVICSDPEHLASPWVHSEWSRYLDIVDEDPGRRLIPLLYGSFSPAQLPAPFRYRRLQALNMSDVDAMPALLSLLKKPEESPAQEEADESQSALPVAHGSEVMFEFPRRIPEWKGNPRWKICRNDFRKEVLVTIRWGRTSLVHVDAPTPVTVRQGRVSPFWVLFLLLLTAILLFLPAMILFLTLGDTDFTYNVGCSIGLIAAAFFLVCYIRRIIRHFRKVLTFTVTPGKRYRLYWDKDEKLAVKELD